MTLTRRGFLTGAAATAAYGMLPAWAHLGNLKSILDYNAYPVNCGSISMEYKKKHHQGTDNGYSNYKCLGVRW